MVRKRSLEAARISSVADGVVLESDAPYPGVAQFTDESMKEFRRRAKAAIALSGLSYAAIGQAMGIENHAAAKCKVSHLINASENPNILDILRLCNVLHVKMETLFFGYTGSDQTS